MFLRAKKGEDGFLEEGRNWTMIDIKHRILGTNEIGCHTFSCLMRGLEGGT